MSVCVLGACVSGPVGVAKNEEGIMSTPMQDCVLCACISGPVGVGQSGSR